MICTTCYNGENPVYGPLQFTLLCETYPLHCTSHSLHLLEGCRLMAEVLCARSWAGCLSQLPLSKPGCQRCSLWAGSGQWRPIIWPLSHAARGVSGWSRVLTRCSTHPAGILRIVALDSRLTGVDAMCGMGTVCSMGPRPPGAHAELCVGWGKRALG